MLRRLLVVALALAVVAAPSLSYAQATIIGPGGVINQATASVTVANSTTATTMYSFQTPAGWVAAVAGSPGAPGLPIHLRVFCQLSTAASTQGLVNVGVSYGTTATVSLANAVLFPISQSSIPLQFTVDVRPTASYSGVNGQYVPYLYATMATQSSTNGSSVPGGATFAAQYLANTADPSGQPTLSIVWQWGTATSGNSVTCYNATEHIGN